MANKSSLWDSIFMLWCGPMWLYFSTWRPHENWVSKTRFTTHINIEEPSTHIRENPEKEKKNPEEPRNPGSAQPGWRVAWVFFTQVHATQVARDPGRMLLGFFSPRYLRLMVGRFFLPSDLIVVIVDFWNLFIYLFFFYGCILAGTRALKFKIVDM